MTPATDGDKLAIWNQLCKTPPQVTSPYIKNGTALTAIDPTYRNKRLTEVFGPAGIGWGFTVDERWSERLCNNDYVFATVTLWIRVEGAGGQKVATYIGGTRIEGEADDAYKSAITDGLTKCASILGFGADIFTGKETTPVEPVTEKSGPYQAAMGAVVSAKRINNAKALEDYVDRIRHSSVLTNEEKGELLSLAEKR